MPEFTPAALARLDGCHPDLKRLMLEVVKHIPCTILQGPRTESEELAHMADGTSKLKDPKASKHVTYALRPLALAVDAAPTPVDWKDLQRWHVFGGFVKGVASQLGIPIRWGGDWDGDYDYHDQTFNDLPHFEVA